MQPQCNRPRLVYTLCRSSFIESIVTVGANNKCYTSDSVLGWKHKSTTELQVFGPEAFPPLLPMVVTRADNLIREGTLLMNFLH